MSPLEREVLVNLYLNMVISLPLAATAASFLLFPHALADGLYAKGSPVIQVTGSTYDNLIARSNHTVRQYFNFYKIFATCRLLTDHDYSLSLSSTLHGEYMYILTEIYLEDGF